MKNQRKIDLIVVHCSATRINQDFPVEALEACHKARVSAPSVTTITLRRMAWSIPAVQKARRVLTPATTTPIASESATRVARRERKACRHSHASPESISGRPPLQSRPRLSRCRDPRPSRPSLGSQELSLLRCQGMLKEIDFHL